MNENPTVKTMPAACYICSGQDNDFRQLNVETIRYSAIEIAVNRQGMLRARSISPTGGMLDQDVVNISFCPVCGRKFDT